MALIYCPECNKEVSDSAKKCPHCGYKLPKKKNKPTVNIKKITIITGLVILLLAVLGILYYFFSPRTVKRFCYHRVTEATCDKAEMCTRCGVTWGTPKGHEWTEESCTEEKVCKVCQKTDGKPKGHKWTNATCVSPKSCINCGITNGSKLGHSVSHYLCTRCEDTIISATDVPNVLDITSMTYEVNSVGGIDQYLSFTNKSSSKTINYITIEIEYYNAVGDLLTDDITRDSCSRLLYTGPLKPGKSSGSQYWRACFYNSTFSGTCTIRSIEIEYSDGQTLVLDEDIADEAVKAWR